MKAGGTKLEFWATSEPEVVGLVLSFGGSVELIEPCKTVVMIEQSASALLANVAYLCVHEGEGDS